MEVEILKDPLRLRSLKLLFEYLENTLWYYHRLVNRLGIKVYSDVIITEEDLMDFIDEKTYKLLNNLNIIRPNPYNPRIIEFINISKLFEVLGFIRDTKRYKLPLNILKSDNQFMQLINYVAPHVKDTPLISEVKKIMLLQLFSNGDRGFRTRIHIGMIGAPGTGKTLLLEWQSDVSGGLLISLRSTSAGLSGSLDPMSFMKSPPVLMMADGKVLCIDEADKIRQDDLDPLLLAMEEGRVVLVGASMKTEYPAKVRIMLASNRKTFKPELIDRFDLFAIFRRYTKSEVKEIVGHLVDMSENPEVIDKGKKLIKNYMNMAEKFIPKIVNKNEVSKIISDIVEETKSDSVRGSLRWLRFAYAYARINRKNITPDLVLEVYDILKNNRRVQEGT